MQERRRLLLHSHHAASASVTFGRRTAYAHKEVHGRVYEGSPCEVQLPRRGRRHGIGRCARSAHCPLTLRPPSQCSCHRRRCWESSWTAGARPGLDRATPLLGEGVRRGARSGRGHCRRPPRSRSGAEGRQRRCRRDGSAEAAPDLAWRPPTHAVIVGPTRTTAHPATAPTLQLVSSPLGQAPELPPAGGTQALDRWIEATRQPVAPVEPVREEGGRGQAWDEPFAPPPRVAELRPESLSGRQATCCDARLGAGGKSSN